MNSPERCKNHDRFNCWVEGTSSCGLDACYWTEYADVSDLIEDGSRCKFRRYGTGYTYEYWRAGQQTGDYTFGGITLDETERRIRTGEATDAILARYDELRTQLDLDMQGHPELMEMSARRRMKWNDESGEPDADRVLANHEHHWRESRKGKPMHLVRLGVNITRSCGNGSEGYINAAATCAAVSDTLCRLGYPVQITGISIVHHDCRWTAHTWPLKQPGEALDIGRILTMGLSGLHRFHICNGIRDSGSVWAPCREAYQTMGIDYAFGKQWMLSGQTDIAQGVLNAISATSDDAGLE